MIFRLVLPLLTVIFSVVLISCSGARESASTGVNHQVVISGFEFVPKELKVSSGDTVTWINKDIVPHTIVLNTQQKTISPELAQGKKFVYKVGRSASYICGLHPSMKGKLVNTSQ